MNIANAATLIRLILGLVGAILLALFGPSAAAPALLLFGISVALDGVDGYLARSRNCETILGRSFDAATDNSVLWVHLLALVEFGQFSVWLIAAAVVRELFLQGFWDYAEMCGANIHKIVFGHSRYLCQVGAVMAGESALWLGEDGKNDWAAGARLLSTLLIGTSLLIGYSTLLLTYYLNRDVLARGR